LSDKLRHVLRLKTLFRIDRVRDFVSIACDDGDTREHRLFGLLQALRTALQVVVIELEGDDDPQISFETLNGRGQPLLASNLIQNYIFMQVAKRALV
jgi:hypothetical protein